jgi:hypothetical protein
MIAALARSTICSTASCTAVAPVMAAGAMIAATAIVVWITAVMAAAPTIVATAHSGWGWAVVYAIYGATWDAAMVVAASAIMATTATNRARDASRAIATGTSPDPATGRIFRGIAGATAPISWKPKEK